MTQRMRVLDLFCGAGGAAEGYHQAGFDVVGVDVAPQPHYPFEFIQCDWQEALAIIPGIWEREGVPYAIHASPPCQRYSRAQRVRAREHPDLVGPVRDALELIEAPWVIENVPGAPLIDPIVLCGSMFGLGVDRDRLFEASFSILQPPHPPHRRATKMGRPIQPDTVVQVVGHFSGVAQARAAMGISWMTRDELREAVPPAYTAFVGARLARVVREHWTDVYVSA